LSIWGYLLTANDKVLLTNILDQSGDVILAVEDLKDLIRIATDCMQVEIETGPLEVRCCAGSAKIIPVSIELIKVDGVDFEYRYNRIYNIFGEYKISLDKTVL
jgi:hypothetical protein